MYFENIGFASFSMQKIQFPPKHQAIWPIPSDCYIIWVVLQLAVYKNVRQTAALLFLCSSLCLSLWLFRDGINFLIQLHQARNCLHNVLCVWWVGIRIICMFILCGTAVISTQTRICVLCTYVALNAQSWICTLYHCFMCAQYFFEYCLYEIWSKSLIKSKLLINIFKETLKV